MNTAMKKNNVMLGSDPELLLKKTINTIEKSFPIIGLLGHGKNNPLHIDDSGFRTLQEDNVALEYTTHPTSNKADFLTEQKAMFKIAKAKAIEFGLTVDNRCATSFDHNMLLSKEAKTFGCEATLNAYTNTENTSPDTNVTFRSAGGHVHISYDNPTTEKSLEIAKLLDLVYITSENRPINAGENSRRQLYGKAGEVRLKSYGVEWRVPSNAWVFNDEDINWIWNTVEKAFELYENGSRVKYSKYSTIQEAIDSNRTLQFPIHNFLETPTKPEVKRKSEPKAKKAVKSVAKKKVSRKLVLA
jgi:hypothetical protein